MCRAVGAEFITKQMTRGGVTEGEGGVLGYEGISVLFPICDF